MANVRVRTTVTFEHPLDESCLNDRLTDYERASRYIHWIHDLGIPVSSSTEVIDNAPTR